jgi:hypothetical protein
MTKELPTWVKAGLAAITTVGLFWLLGRWWGDPVPHWILMGLAIVSSTGVYIDDIYERLGKMEKTRE